jgi:hypothetical protein
MKILLDRRDRLAAAIDESGINAAVAVTPRAIRFYEDQGLLAPQRSGSRRIYGKRDYVRLKLTLRGWAAAAGIPWEAGPGTGWGGDHGAPSACTADAEKVYLGWTGAEADALAELIKAFQDANPGVTVETAQAQFATVITRLQHDVAPQPGGRPWNVRISPMRTVLFGRDRPYLQVVVAAGSLVLLMACANLASLLLARGRSRERDAAIRASLGASRARLVTGALLESLLVCACGGAVAVGVLAWSGPALLAVLPPLFSHAAAGLADARVLGFALVAGGASAVVAGVAPGWRAARVDVLAVLQRTASSGRRVRGACGFRRRTPRSTSRAIDRRST